MDWPSVLKEHNQEHLLAFADQLTPEQRASLEADLAAIEWDQLDDWIENCVKKAPEGDSLEGIAPAPYLPASPANPAQEAEYEEAKALGEKLLREGKVGAFTVAGGQGTRLGFDAPKGTFKISPIRNRPLFAIFADKLLRASEKYGVTIPWYVMTSPATDAPTREWFAENGYLGYEKDAVFFLMQGTMPCFDFEGKIFLSAPDAIAKSPDGHGGSIKALAKSGALADMQSRGIEYLSYFQVDNPLVSVVDPLFIGLHVLENSEMSSRCLIKVNAAEKMGVFCRFGDVTRIVEYSDLPDELAEETDSAGKLRYAAGSPAIHVLSRTLIERLNAGETRLPFHRAVKKIPHVDASGNAVSPSEPNGVKLETFVFDAIPMANGAMVLAADRVEEFAPVKNAEGSDSPATARAGLQEKLAAWLSRADVEVPRNIDGSLNCTIELNERAILDEADLQALPVEKLAVAPGASIVIG
jgi:UDP-N-acetylglucosamine/UDP-N-acetylgalactosamine diphosphorylase